MTTDNSSQTTQTSTGPETSGASETTTSAASSASSSQQAQSQASQPLAGGSVASAVEQGLANAQAPTPPQYQPNFKFKAFDKEYEVDELFRPLIKDSETEEKIKKLHSKAYAMEAFQEKLHKSRSEYDQFKQSIEPKVKSFDYFNVLLENKDWDTFFNKLGVPDEEIFSFVEKKLALLNAPADQRAEYERQLALRQQHYAQSQQLQEIQQAYQQQAVQTRTMQLESLMARADVTNYAASWDSKVGNVGAFRQLVIEEAANVYHATGRDMSAEEAINHVIQKFGKVVGPMGAQPAQASPAQQTPAAAAPPIIPHVAGRGTSPVKKVPKSLDDLKKLADEMTA